MKILFNFNKLKNIKFKEILSYVKNYLFNKKTIVLLIIASIIAFTFFYSTKREEKISLVPNFSIETQEVIEEELYVTKTYPSNNSETSAFSISIDFSKSIINKKISVSTIPYMELETKVLDSNPFKLFIIPQKPWEYQDYKLVIKNDELKEDFILNLKFKEQEQPTPIIESGIRN